MAGSSKTSSPKTRRGRAKASAPKTGSADFNNENYNIRSPERTELLTKIKGILNHASVSPTLWACCQLADMKRLQAITKWEEEVINSYNKSLGVIALKWTQRFRDSEFPGSGAAERHPEGSKRRKLNSDTPSSMRRSPKEAQNYTERDNYKCVLTRMAHSQAAHIVPFSMLHPDLKTDRNKASNAISDFWDLLPLFWDKERVKKWRNTIFPNGIGVEGCFNLISLSPDAHDMWNRGVFALKPLKLSCDRKKLTVQFFWQVPGNYKIDNRIDLLTKPTSSQGLEIVANGHFLSRLENDGSGLRIRLIRSGELFTFTTEDPQKLPLPSIELLEMQWILQRLVGMCGAAGWPSLDEDEDDSVDNDNN